MNKTEFDTFLLLKYGTYDDSSEASSFYKYLGRLPEGAIRRASEIMQTENLGHSRVEEAIYRALKEYHDAERV